MNKLELHSVLLLYPRVISYDARKDTDIPADVIVERLFDPSMYQYDDTLAETCRFHLAVIRQGKCELSKVCRDSRELRDVLIAEVHGGRELCYGKHWFPIDAQQCIHHDTLQHLVLDRYSAIQHRLTYLEDMVDKQDRCEKMIAPALARTWLKEVREIMGELYLNAKGTDDE